MAAINRKSAKQKSMLHEIDETLKSKQVIRGGKSAIHQSTWSPRLPAKWARIGIRIQSG